MRQRNFSLTVTDHDGNEQVYLVIAPSAYNVASIAWQICATYGHNLNEAVTLEIHELIPEADMGNASKVAI